MQRKRWPAKKSQPVIARRFAARKRCPAQSEGQLPVVLSWRKQSRWRGLVQNAEGPRQSPSNRRAPMIDLCQVHLQLCSQPLSSALEVRPLACRTFLPAPGALRAPGRLSKVFDNAAVRHRVPSISVRPPSYAPGMCAARRPFDRIPALVVTVPACAEGVRGPSYPQTCRMVPNDTI